MIVPECVDFFSEKQDTLIGGETPVSQPLDSKKGIVANNELMKRLQYIITNIPKENLAVFKPVMVFMSLVLQHSDEVTD